MEPSQAAEQLQTIRTLMERSAVYRRALAPIMMFCGVVGIIGGIAGEYIADPHVPGHWIQIHTDRSFILFWVLMATVALTGSILLVRRQALRDSEPFWSPPTRRVLQALTPPFLIGAFFSLVPILSDDGNEVIRALLIPAWSILYGLAVYSAGFFLPGGLKIFGWFFIIIGCLLFLVTFAGEEVVSIYSLYSHPHWLMGAIFGGLHLACGIYLYFTEKRGKAS